MRSYSGLAREVFKCGAMRELLVLWDKDMLAVVVLRYVAQLHNVSLMH